MSVAALVALVSVWAVSGGRAVGDAGPARLCGERGVSQSRALVRVIKHRSAKQQIRISVIYQHELNSQMSH